MEHNYDEVWCDSTTIMSQTKSCELYSNSPRAAGSLNSVGNYIHDSTLFKCMSQIRSGKTNIWMIIKLSLEINQNVNKCL